MDKTVRIEVPRQGVNLDPKKKRLGVTGVITNHSEEPIRVDFNISASNPKTFSYEAFSLSENLDPGQTKEFKSDTRDASHIIDETANGGAFNISAPRNVRVTFLDTLRDEA